MKKILKLSLFAIIIFFFVSKVSALTDEEIKKLDTDGFIGMPAFITSNGSKVNVYKTSDYNLFYQWKEMSLETYNNLKSKNEEMKKVYDEEVEYSKTNKPDTSDREAVNKYNEKIKEYNEKINEFRNQYYKLLPSFGNDWISVNLSENKVYPPSDVFSGKKPFVLYVKLEDKQNSNIIYDYGVLQLDGDNDESKIEDDSDDIKKDVVTTTKKVIENNNISNPKTADVKITLVMLGILVMGMFVILGYKKVKKKG